MADDGGVTLASLAVGIDTTPVPEGVRRLHELADAGGQAETAARRLTAAERELAAETRNLTGVAAASGSAHANATQTLVQEARAVEQAANAYADFYDAMHRDFSSQFVRQMEASTKAQRNAADQAKNAYGEFYDTAQKNFATQYVRQLGAIEKGHAAGAKAAKLQAYEVLNLTRNLGDVFVTGAMGMSPFMIAIQQGPQIADIFQTAGQRGVGFKDVMADIGGMALRVLGKAGPFAIGAAVIGGLGAAFLAGEKDANRFANALAVTGNFAGVTAGQLEAMSRRTADATDMSVGKARDAIATLVSTGDFSARSIDLLSKSALQLSDYTGKSAGEVAADFAKMGDSVADYATRFNDQHHVMNLAQLEHIRALEERGDVEAAQYAASVAIYEGLGKIGPANLGYVERGWRSLTGAMSEAWESLKRFGSPEAINAGRMASISSRIANLQREGGENPNAIIQGRINALQDEWIALSKNANAAEAQAKAAADAARVTDAGVAAAERMRGQWAGLSDNTAKARSEISKYRSDIEAIRKADPTSNLIPSAERQKADEAAILKRYTPEASAAAKKATSAAESAAKAAQRHAEQLDREARAMEAATAGALKTAEAYRISDAEALRAAATAEATAKAITKRGDAEEFVRRQLDLNAAKAAEQAAKTVAGVEAQNAAQERANEAVRSGAMTQEQANARMAIEAQLRPLIAQADAASSDAKQNLTEQIIRLAFAQQKYNELKKAEQLLADRDRTRDQIELLRLEARMVGATVRERAVAIAQLQKEIELRRTGMTKMPGAKAAIDEAGAAAGLGVDVQQANDNYNASLNYTLELLDQISAHTRDAAAGWASAFDGMGDSVERAAGAMGGLAVAFADLNAREESIRVRREADQKDQVKGSAAWMHAELLASRETAKARVGAYGDMAAAGRSFFEEGTAGYKVMQAAEIAFRGVEMVMSIRAMTQKGVETAVVLAQAGIEVGATASAEAAKTALTAAGTAARTPMKVAEGAASMFASLGPLGFVAVGGMLAVMAALGFSGSGRGGTVPGATDMEDRQKAQGAGSVLGDANAKSASIAKSLEIVASNTNKDLEYANGMLKALRNIETGIGAVAVALSRTLGASGALDTAGLNLGASGRPATLGNLGFGNTTTRELQDQGLQFGSQSLADILAGGIDGQTYQQVLQTKVKKAFGITYSNKSSVQTTTGSLDADLANQITGLIGSLKAGVLEAASVLGVNGAEATLDAFKVELGKLSFKDMSGAEIQEALSAIFGKLGDDLAATAIPELTQLQKVGEGAFETLARVARQYQVLDTSLTSIGMTFGAVGVSSLKARERLVDLVGGIDELAEQAGYFAENFLSDLERMAPIQRAVASELERLGLANVKTKEDFKNVVLGLDLTTEAGAKLYASLMDLAPAFSKVVDFQVEGSKEVQTWRDAVLDAYEREAGALENTRDKLRDAAKSLRDFAASLDPLLDASTGETLDRAQREMMDRAARADLGDTDALNGLQASIQAYLQAAEADAGTSLEYQMAVAVAQGVARSAERSATAQANIAQQQLDVMKASVEAELGTQKAVYTLAEAMAGYHAAIAAQAAAAVAPPATSNPTPSTPAANDNPAPTQRGPDWASYMVHYPDVAAEYARNMASEKGRAYLASLGVGSAEQFGEMHWTTNGKREGRTPYGDGGFMDRPITLGEMGLGGEAGPEGILPLANVGGKLGVRATGGGDNAQLARMYAELQNMNAALISIARSTHELNRNFRRAMAEGLYVRGPEPDAPVQTKAAA